MNVVLIPVELDQLSFPELWNLAGACRFNGTPMLSNRILTELRYFVSTAIFEEKSGEAAFFNAYHGYHATVDDEGERIRRYLVLMIMFNYEEEWRKYIRIV
jgi:hypothetical protein